MGDRSRRLREEHLSSPLTFVFKLIVPVVWPLLVGLLAARGVDDQGGQPEWELFYAGGGWLTGMLIVWWTCVPLKVVRLRDGDTLMVSNYLREVGIPVTRLLVATHLNLISLTIITLTFRDQTPFGREVRFIPADLKDALGRETTSATLRRLEEVIASAERRGPSPL
jgi:hypothetical protein